MKKLGIIFGGRSVEHDISIITGLQILKVAQKNYDVFPIYVDGNGEWWTAKNIQDISIYTDFQKRAKGKKRVFVSFGKSEILCGLKRISIESMVVCLHGVNGEDGSVAAILEQAKIDYTSSSVLASALTMDKSFTKMILDFYNIKNANFFVLKRAQNLNLSSITEKISFPIIVKPANLGSSVGINVCKDENDLKEALEVAFDFDDKVVLEEFLEGSKEYNCACFMYDEKCYLSNVVEVDKSEIFSFDEKYILEKESKTKRINKDLEISIKNLTEKVYKIFDCFGVVRVDFLVYKDEIYVNEINSVPGALSCYMFDEKFDEILDLLIIESKTRTRKKENIKYSYQSDALKVFENEEKLTRFKK